MNVDSLPFYKFAELASNSISFLVNETGAIGNLIEIKNNCVVLEWYDYIYSKEAHIKSYISKKYNTFLPLSVTKSGRKAIQVKSDNGDIFHIMLLVPIDL